MKRNNILLVSLCVVLTGTIAYFLFRRYIEGFEQLADPSKDKHLKKAYANSEIDPIYEEKESGFKIEMPFENYNDVSSAPLNDDVINNIGLNDTRKVPINIIEKESPLYKYKVFGGKKLVEPMTTGGPASIEETGQDLQVELGLPDCDMLNSKIPPEDVNIEGFGNEQLDIGSPKNVTYLPKKPFTSADADSSKSLDNMKQGVQSGKKVPGFKYQKSVPLDLSDNRSVNIPQERMSKRPPLEDAREKIESMGRNSEDLNLEALEVNKVSVEPFTQTIHYNYIDDPSKKYMSPTKQDTKPDILLPCHSVFALDSEKRIWT